MNAGSRNENDVWKDASWWRNSEWLVMESRLTGKKICINAERKRS